MRRVLAGAAVAVALTIALLGESTTSPAAPVGVSLDIELAFDTTGSMARSLAAAEQDAQRVVAGVRAVAPDARFAVVSFRDPGNSAGQYKVLQPLTSDAAAVQSALSKLEAHGNTSPENLPVESYNLAFHRSYADPTLHWRPQARKIVVVVGDAEGYGAGNDGLPGCEDRHVDPDGFDTKTELAAMRAAGRTLVMIREGGPDASAALECYRSMAALSYPGGAARNGNAADLVTPLLALVHGAVAPVTLAAPLPLVLPGSTARVLVTLANPNGFAIQADSLSLTVPSGFGLVSSAPAATATAGSTPSWEMTDAVAPRGRRTFSVVLRVPPTARRAVIRAKGTFELPDGAQFASRGETMLHVTRTLGLRANARARGSRISGAATVMLPRRGSLAAAVRAQASGLFTISAGRTVVRARAYQARVTLGRSTASAVLAVRVTAGSGLPRCRTGTRGTVTFVEHAFGSLSGLAAVRAAIPGCSSAAVPAARGASIRPMP